jgi:hypothetical protein
VIRHALTPLFYCVLAFFCVNLRRSRVAAGKVRLRLAALSDHARFPDPAVRSSARGLLARGASPVRLPCVIRIHPYLSSAQSFTAARANRGCRSGLLTPSWHAPVCGPKTQGVRRSEIRTTSVRGTSGGVRQFLSVSLLLVHWKLPATCFTARSFAAACNQALSTFVAPFAAELPRARFRSPAFAVEVLHFRPGEMPNFDFSL